MTERKLATIRRISEIKDIEGADLIQAYRVDGWWVVGQKGQYALDSLVVYCEIDSWIPTELAPFLSRGKEPREYNGIKGERLKTIKLRGQVSQGLLLPKDLIYQLEDNGDFVLEEGQDVSEILGITKWELSEKEFQKRFHQNPEARQGGFPWFIPKSDQERIQNIKDSRIKSWEEKELTFEVTEKLEGSSMTVYHVNNKHTQDEGVCSRNINLKHDLENNKYWYVANKYGLLDKIKAYGNIAIQGELVGPGVCGNIYKLDEFYFYCYNSWDIDNQRWLLPKERRDLCNLLDIPHVPVLSWSTPPLKSREEYLEKADGYSALSYENVRREGLVYKSNTTPEQFKTVSNKYLLGER